MKMEKVRSFEDILKLTGKIKSTGKQYMTNFFPDEFRTNLWINYDQLYFENYGRTIIFTRKNLGFNNLFYVASDTDSLYKAIEKYSNSITDIPNVIDIVGRKSIVEKTESDILNLGFFKYTRLFRMTRNIDNYKKNEDKNIYNANVKDLEPLYRLLHEYFDIFAEQLPLKEEILNWIQKKTVLIYGDLECKIQGFIIFELHGQTSYLRYWFVHPDYRDRKIGSALLYNYLEESRFTARQLFWVIDSNENAIKRYLHYGFSVEDLFDTVLINKDIEYGRKNN